MHSWDWTLAEIRYPQYMICHKLQGFKICSGQGLAYQRLRHCAQSGIQVLSLQAYLLEINLQSILRYALFVAETYK
jgi:hypothetical protein